MKKLYKKIKNIRNTLKEVYRKPIYFFISFLIAIILILFNIGIINYRIYLKFPSFEIVSKIFLGTFSTMPLYSIVALFLASVLTGILISLLAYHIKSLGSLNKTSKTGFFGMALGVIAPGCASCGIGIVALLGFTGIIGNLPFSGLEISLLGVLLLGFAIISLSTKISTKTCNVKENYFLKIRRRIMK